MLDELRVVVHTKCLLFPYLAHHKYLAYISTKELACGNLHVASTHLLIVVHLFKHTHYKRYHGHKILCQTQRHGIANIRIEAKTARRNFNTRVILPYSMPC